VGGWNFNGTIHFLIYMLVIFRVTELSLLSFYLYH